MKILHIISGLENAGTERNLSNIVLMDKENIHIVISLSGPGYFGKILKQNNIKVYSLCINYNLKKIYHLYKIIKLENPNLVQTWLIYADMLGGMAARLAGIKKIIWSIRSDGIDFSKEKLKLVPFYFFFILLLFVIPTKIITNLKLRKLKFLYLFNKKKFHLIYNGFHIPRMKKIKKNKKFIIGHLGRYHPIKNHKMILSIAEELKKKEFNYLMILGGKKVDKKNSSLMKILKDKNLSDNVKLIGEITKINNFYQNLDCVISTSFSEGFPNILAESMANGVISLSTDTGEAKKIVKFSWRIFDNSNSLIKKIIYLNSIKINNYNKWLLIKKDCSNHIKKFFSIEKMIINYNKIWNLN
jgi:glycosyltransferase involved in cell wall biosynthesis